MSSGWTIETLKEYIEQKFDSIEQAVTKAETATEKRFEGVNEFRLQLGDQARTFIARTEVESLVTSIKERNESEHSNLKTELQNLKERLDKIENMKQGGAILWGWIIGVAGLVSLIVTLIFKFL